MREVTYDSQSSHPEGLLPSRVDTISAATAAVTLADTCRSCERGGNRRPFWISSTGDSSANVSAATRKHSSVIWGAQGFREGVRRVGLVSCFRFRKNNSGDWVTEIHWLRRFI